MLISHLISYATTFNNSKNRTFSEKTTEPFMKATAVNVDIAKPTMQQYCTNFRVFYCSHSLVNAYLGLKIPLRWSLLSPIAINNKIT